MKARSIILFQVFLSLLLAGCATHEMVLSRTLRPVLSSEDIDFPVSLFRSRVQMDRLEVWVVVKRSDSDYMVNFNNEIESAAAVCVALSKSELTFKNDWNKLVLELTTEYGSQWLWRNTLGFAKVRITRKALLELRARNLPASEYPKYWDLFAYKVGPPDYVPYEWSSDDVKTNSESSDFDIERAL